MTASLNLQRQIHVGCKQLGRAGDRVNLAHGVNGGSGKQRQIGGAM